MDGCSIFVFVKIYIKSIFIYTKYIDKINVTRQTDKIDKKEKLRFVQTFLCLLLEKVKGRALRAPPSGGSSYMLLSEYN
jgi:hypothetical protein